MDNMKEIKFLIYCIEIYKESKQMNGSELVEIFSKYHIFEFLYDTYDSLHMTNREYICEEIDIVLDLRKK
jgi:hypothetical protein